MVFKICSKDIPSCYEIYNSVDELSVEAASDSNCPNANSIVYVGLEHHLEACTMQPGCIIISKKFAHYPTGTLIVHERPRLVYALLLSEAFERLGNKPKWNKHSHSTAEIGENTTIAETAVVGENAVIGKNCVVEPGVCIFHDVIIGDDCHIGANAVIGKVSGVYERNYDGKVVMIHPVGTVRIGNGVTIDPLTVVQKGMFSDTVINDDAIIGCSCDIAHDVTIGKQVQFNDGVQVCGFVDIGEKSVFSTGVIVKNRLSIGKNVNVVMGSVVLRDVADGRRVMGNPARDITDLKK